MTKFIKNLIATVGLGLVLITPAMAAECTVATKEDAHEQVAGIPGVVIRELTKAEIAKLIDKKGPPPNAEGTDDLEMELVQKEEIAGINVYQKGCFINRLGPTLIETIKSLLEEKDA